MFICQNKNIKEALKFVENVLLVDLHTLENRMIENQHQLCSRLYENNNHPGVVQKVLILHGRYKYFQVF